MSFKTPPFKTPSLTTPFVNFIPFDSSHFDQLMSWINSPSEQVCWTGPVIPYPLTHTQLQFYVDENRQEPPAIYCWMVTNESDVIIGHIQLVCDWHNRVGRIARVIVAPEHRGKGYAKPMVRKVLAYAFQELDMARVELNVYPRNPVAYNTYQQMGFTLEGIRRSSAVVGNERWDTAIMAMLKDER